MTRGYLKVSKYVINIALSFLYKKWVNKEK